MQAIMSFLKDESGPTAVEYAVMLALILMGAIAGIQLLGTRIGEVWTNNKTQIEST